MSAKNSNFKIVTEENGGEYSFYLENISEETIYPEEIVVLEGNMPFDGNTCVYCDGFNMLSQYTGTVECMKNIGLYSDKEHYRFMQKEGYFTGYNYALFYATETTLLGFSSCNRFGGEIRFNKDRVEIVQRIFSIPVKSHEKIRLEDFCILKGEKYEVLNRFSKIIEKNHKRRRNDILPVGWCSWYCFGPNVTDKNIRDNIAVMKQKFSIMKYVLIDDGYQNKMGDWLENNIEFGSIKKLCDEICSAGLEPAIWIAPFVAEKNSRLFKEHPDYFVKDDSGEPLASDRVTFGGWRCAPWYMLDGTHPEARAYIKRVFKTMKKKYNCSYFKLDANMWGAMPFGKRYDNTKTPIEGYRMMMETICEAVGEDGFILGCNAPMWPSLGLVNAMRTSGDVSRNTKVLSECAKENMLRAWQNERLWLCDTDCLVLTDNRKDLVDAGGKLLKEDMISKDELLYSAAYAFACGGSVIFSGDDMTKYKKREIEFYNKIKLAEKNELYFNGNNIEISKNEKYYVILNDTDREKVYSIAAEKIFDFVSGREIENPVKVSAHCGKIIAYKL